MTRYIDDHRERFGVTPICDVLGWNVSTYYAHRHRPPSDRALRDDQLAPEVRRVFEANYRVYGYRKVHAQLRREGFTLAECTVRRLMRREGLHGAVRGWKKPRTTVPGTEVVRPPDLLDRDFTAPGPDRRWVADLTYVRLTTGRFVYAAVIDDVFSRKIVGRPVVGTGGPVVDSPEQRRRRGLDTDRLEAFSDGVFAIAITVLVLELSLPEDWLQDPLGAFLGRWPTYLAYVVSFASIGAVWLAHTAITQRVDSGDTTFARLNLLLLMMVSFLTFPTSLVGEAISTEGAERVATTIFGLNLLLVATITALLWRHARRSRLVRADVSDEEAEVLTQRLTPSLGGYVVLIVVGMFLPLVAVVGYLAIALVLLLPVRRQT
jgi:uncharacterized membrane protein